MRKSFKRIGLLTLTGMLALSQASTAFAATKQSGSGKSELSSYNAELATQRTKLSELISESKALTAKITAEQKNVKTKGYITKSSSDTLAKYSSEIKAKRQELTGERSNNKTLRAAAKEARMSGDITTAKDQLILLEAVQEKQIKIRTELVELLEAKLNYLNSITGTGTTGNETADDTTEAAETVAAEINNVSAPEAVAAESSIAAEAVAEETNAEAAAEETSAEAATPAETTVEAETSIAAEQKEEIITDQAAIDAVLDDGAELEGEDF